MSESAWKQNALESLAGAKLLKESQMYRSCLSRAYYSCYAAVTSALLQNGHEVGHAGMPNPSHPQVERMARNNLPDNKYPQHVREKLARDIRRLYSLRLTADYDPESSIIEQDAQDSLRRVSNVHKALGLEVAV